MRKSTSVLIFFIILLATFVSIAGLLPDNSGSRMEFKSVRGETVVLYGSGLYKYDSVSVAAQGRASDLVTLFLAVPLLLVSYLYTVKGSMRGRFMLTGTLGYFLYTYMSYTFLWMYNPLFIVYVALMSMSFFAFVQCFMSLRSEDMAAVFKKTLPVKFLGGFQLVIGFMVGMLWLAKLVPTLDGKTVPVGLMHYTTLTIQGMDLGFVVPAAILSGIWLIKREPLGYLLSAVMIMKGVTMLTAISAMLINMALNGVWISPVEAVLFSLFNFIAIICLVILLKNIHPNLPKTTIIEHV